MSFLDRLLSLFKKSSEAELADQNPGKVAPDERLTRFIFRKQWYAKSEKRVLADGLMPHPTHRPWQTSTYRTGAMDTADVWRLGQQVRGQRPENIKARADVFAAKVTVVHSLYLSPTSVGVAVAPHLHVDIMGWPDLPEVQRMWATEVAAAASLHLPEAS
jgi:hypothetical protein